MPVPGSSRLLVLLMEDSAVTSLVLEDELNDNGYAVEFITSCATALIWLNAFTPDAAILDVSLKNETCREVADTLAARGIPFVIYSARRQHEGLLPDYPGVEWVSKPCRHATLLAALTRALAARLPT